MLGYDIDTARAIIKKAKPKYWQIIRRLPEFEKADCNPYSCNIEFYEYPDGSGYEGHFTKCGICMLMKELGLLRSDPCPVPSGL